MNEYKVGIYLRLSKEDSLDESESIKNQRIYIMDYLNKNNLTLVKEYIDDGVSGTNFNREGFNELLRDIEAKEINMVVTKDTSRLGRNIAKSLYYSTEYFEEKNVRYVAINDAIDTFDHHQNTDLLLFKTFYNEMYVKDISSKIKATLVSQKRLGNFMGSSPPYGYDKDIYDKHRLVINKEQSLVVKKIYELFIKGYSVHMIASELTKEKIMIPSIAKSLHRGIKSKVYGIWQDTTIKSILTNPTYMGNITQNREYKISYKSLKRRKHHPSEWIIASGKCPAIIDAQTFALVQNIFKQNKRNNGKNNYLLKGLLYCNECHHSMALNNKNCYCNYYKKYSKYNVCTPHKINYEFLEQEVINHLKEIIKPYLNYEHLKKCFLDNDELSHRRDELSKLITNYLEEKKTIESYLSLTYHDRLKGIIDIDTYISESKRLKDNLTNIIKDIDDKKKELSYIEDKINNIDIDTLIEDYLTFKDQRLLSYLIDKIYIEEDKNITIYFKTCSNFH